MRARFTSAAAGCWICWWERGDDSRLAQGGRPLLSVSGNFEMQHTPIQNIRKANEDGQASGWYSCQWIISANREYLTRRKLSGPQIDELHTDTSEPEQIPATEHREVWQS